MSEMPALTQPSLRAVVDPELLIWITVQAAIPIHR